MHFVIKILQKKKDIEKFNDYGGRDKFKIAYNDNIYKGRGFKRSDNLLITIKT